jgi:hypothetical protein
MRALVILLLLPFAYAIAQVDTTIIVTDSVTVGEQFEDLVEQNPDADDAPLMDLVATERELASTRFSFASRSRVRETLQRSRGYERGTYLGSRMYAYQRLTARYGDGFRAGLLLKKNAGERNLGEFTSGYIAMSSDGFIRRVVAGDYYIESGFGVTLWRGFDYSKGAEVIVPVRRKARGIVPYASSSDYPFFRGAAAEVSVGNGRLVGFYSRRALSATIDADGRVTSIYTSGYYRTPTEILKKGNLSERVLGVRGLYVIPFGRLGMTAYMSKYSRELLLDKGYRFNDDRTAVAALDYSLDISPISFFGEWTRSNFKFGGMSAVVMSPTSMISLITAFRHYPYEFVNLHGLGFGERATTSNETGLYYGVRIRPMRRVLISAYADHYRFPRATSSVIFPATGNDFLVQAVVTASSRTEITVRFHQKSSESRMQFAQHDLTVGGNETQRRRQARLNLRHTVSKAVQLRARWEEVFVDANLSGMNERGTVLYQDVSVRQSERLTWSARLVFFRTDSFNSRIVEYENDVPGILTLPGLFGRGIRYYVLLRYGLWDWFEVSAKYSDLFRDDVKRIGSGNDELPSNRDNRISLQVDLML